MTAATSFYECDIDGHAYIGLGVPTRDEPLRLYPTPAERVLSDAAMRGVLGSTLDELTTTATSIAEHSDQRPRPRFFPPMLRSAGAALAGGFMQTHNVKVEGAPPDQPNWFFKGLGASLDANGDPLHVSDEVIALCEEAEVVLVYVVDIDRKPRYLGYTFGNDLTDIGRFKANRGHLAYAKLCQAAISPVLFMAAPPRVVTGSVTISRGDVIAWRGRFRTGVDAIYYGVDRIVEHLFTAPTLLVPGTLHYVYLGADTGSFQAGFRIEDGDGIAIDIPDHGVRLSNSIHYAPVGTSRIPAQHRGPR